MASLARAGLRTNFNKVWLGDRAVYPLFAVIGAGCCIATYAGYRHAFLAPDVHFNRANRYNAFREEQAKLGARWAARVATHSVPKEQLRNLDIPIVDKLGSKF